MSSSNMYVINHMSLRQRSSGRAKERFAYSVPFLVNTRQYPPELIKSLMVKILHTEVRS